MKLINKIKDGFLIFFNIFVIVPIIFVCSVILVDSFMHPNDVPSFFGWKPFVVLSNSMTPTIQLGDLVIVKKVDSDTIKEGDIIAYNLEDVIITHRVSKIEIQDEKRIFTMKGDANSAVDDYIVKEDNIEGKYRLRIGGLGKVCLSLQTPVGMIISLSIPMVLLFILQYFDGKSEKKMNKNGD